MSAIGDEHRKEPIPPHAHTSDRFSIDLSLELEHQLEHMESPPVLNDIDTATKKHESLDPHVLAHIIMQLRQSLAEMTKERDELVKALSVALSKEAELNDALQLMTDKATSLEEELTEAKKKAKEGEEAVALLRSKVEESRRGLMRLQTENRRQSGNFEAARSSMALSFGGSPPTSKRASFAPLTGTLHASRANGHQRLSSVSDVNVFSQPMTQDLSSPGPGTQDFPLLDALGPSRRASSVFGRHSPPPSQLYDDTAGPELEILRKELQSAKDELEDIRHRLVESNEAREASETCVKALRDFIADNNIGVRDAGTPPMIQLPLPPTMATGEADMEGHKSINSGGWRFGKLWKADHGVKSSISGVASVSSPSIGPITLTPQAVSASTPNPLTKKLGGFFSSRPNIPLPATPQINGGSGAGTPQFQSNATVIPTSHRESIYSSDTSSITKPASFTEANTEPRISEPMAGSAGLDCVAGQIIEGKDAPLVNETVIIR